MRFIHDVATVVDKHGKIVYPQFNENLSNPVHSIDRGNISTRSHNKSRALLDLRLIIKVLLCV